MYLFYFLGSANTRMIYGVGGRSQSCFVQKSGSNECWYEVVVFRVVLDAALRWVVDVSVKQLLFIELSRRPAHCPSRAIN